MTLEEEVKLLERKVELLKEIIGLQVKIAYPNYPIYPTFPTYPQYPVWYTYTSCDSGSASSNNVQYNGTMMDLLDADFPSRLNDVEESVRQGMIQPCTFS